MSGVPDRVLLAPVESNARKIDEQLTRHLSILTGLADEDASVLISALDMHYGACLLLDRDLASAAYTLLVAGIEALSRRFGQPPGDWRDWDQADRWDRICESAGLRRDQSDAVRTG